MGRIMSQDSEHVDLITRNGETAWVSKRKIDENREEMADRLFKCRDYCPMGREPRITLGFMRNPDVAHPG